jgi:heme ABC exporter ATP-binding subunit CcmA
VTPLSTETNPAITLSQVVKRFGRHAALDGIHATFHPAKLTVLLGENGAGKSTLLRIIAGLAKPNSGSVNVAGATDPREWCASIGYMAHASLLYEEMTGLENLEYFAGLYGVAKEACAKAIASVGLDPQLTTRVSGYSQGMRQRMSLARAMLHKPPILLLDEPFSNTDANASQQMVQMIAKQRDAGCAVLVVTHQPALLENVADEFITMHMGKITGQRAGKHAGAEGRG